MLQPFHLAIPVTSLAKARRFYGELLGCETGRFSEQWIDWNFFGHQLGAVYLSSVILQQFVGPLYKAE
ncbi:hypothetical protein [Bowmanella yangjiangensis]|uniref:hypothetical protein n=1 Tax=Bowmanella yangjiangensis TaxID=2811230 RepID=UPI0038CC05CB